MGTTAFHLTGDGKGHPDTTVEEAVRALCAIDRINGRHVIQMPVSTASGSLISVTVWHDGDFFMVTDDGMALHEILSAGASERVFSRIASERSRNYGAVFDGGMMLYIRVSKGHLKGAIIAMANLVRGVIDETIEHSFRAAIDRRREQFIKTATEAYQGYNVREHVKMTGFSTATHEFDLLVYRDGRPLVFDYFSKAGNAVNSAYLKLSDMARLENGVKPVGVTPNPDAIGPKLTLITSVADVIRADAEPHVYAQLAA